MPCGCPSYEFFSNINDVSVETQNETQTEANLATEMSSQDFTEESTSYFATSSLINVPVIDIETDEVENIEDLLDNSNNMNQKPRDSIEMTLPLRIIIPLVHMHFNNQSQNYWKYDQFVLKTDNQSYHGHLQDGERLLEINKGQANLQNVTSIESKIFVGNRSLHDIQTVAKTDRIFIDQSGRTYKILKELIGAENVYEIIPVDFDIVQVTLSNKMSGVRLHYEQLNRWLMFKV